jgi:hypothetical protein
MTMWASINKPFQEHASTVDTYPDDDIGTEYQPEAFLQVSLHVLCIIEQHNGFMHRKNHG